MGWEIVREGEAEQISIILLPKDTTTCKAPLKWTDVQDEIANP